MMEMEMKMEMEMEMKMKNKIMSKQLISLINFYDRYEKFLGSLNDDRTEFFGICGNQLYRLLSYLSSSVNNAIIIDIGTHCGHSALALSYNPTNVVHTFDIECRVTNDSIKNVSNIKFHMDNLFDTNGREKWKGIILQSLFIYLDVDPHNKTMENDLYRYLENIGYNGFVIRDDIWQFKDRHDNFWYKIPYCHSDLTELGRYSETGLFTFNKKI